MITYKQIAYWSFVYASRLEVRVTADQMDHTNRVSNSSAHIFQQPDIPDDLQTVSKHFEFKPWMLNRHLAGRKSPNQIRFTPFDSIQTLSFFSLI